MKMVHTSKSYFARQDKSSLRLLVNYAKQALLHLTCLVAPFTDPHDSQMLFPFITWHVNGGEVVRAVRDYLS